MLSSFYIDGAGLYIMLAIVMTVLVFLILFGYWYVKAEQRADRWKSMYIREHRECVELRTVIQVRRYRADFNKFIKEQSGDETENGEN